MTRIVVAALISFTVIGCSVPFQHSFPNTDKSRLWTVMVATASAPEYTSQDKGKRWVVVENEVDANPTRAQIDVRRIITRSLQFPQQKVQNDRREVIFTVYLLPVDPPTVEFVSRSTTLIPVYGANEAKRYFSSIEAMLVPIK